MQLSRSWQIYPTKDSLREGPLRLTGTRDIKIWSLIVEDDFALCWFLSILIGLKNQQPIKLGTTRFFVGFSVLNALARLKRPVGNCSKEWINVVVAILTFYREDETYLGKSIDCVPTSAICL